MKKNFRLDFLKKLFAALGIFILIPAIVNAQEKEKTLILKVENEPYILRCFSEFDKKVKSHSVAVGFPSQVHFLYDANSGSLLKVWRGEFVDAAPMWINRGGGFFKTPAKTKDISDAPTFTTLQDKNEKWPDSLNPALNYKFKGYKCDKSGRPTFTYTVGNYTVQDNIQPLESKDGLSRTIVVNSSQNSSGLYFLLADGSDIRKSSKGIYTISGRDFAIKIDDSKSAKVVVREVNDTKELLLQVSPSSQTTVKYSIIF